MRKRKARSSFLPLTHISRCIAPHIRRLSPCMLSERIAYGKMQALSVAERRYVVETVLVRHVKTHAPVKAQHEELKVVAQTDACSQRGFLQQVLHLEQGICAVAVVTQCPHVARIEERGSVEIAEQAETVLEVGLQLKVSGLIHIRRTLAVSVISTGSDAAHIESPYAVGSSHIELLTVRRAFRIAVRPYESGADVPHKLTVVAHCLCLAEVGLYLEELRIRILEHLLVLAVPFFPRSQITE